MSPAQDLTQVLAQVPLFQGLSKRQIQGLATAATQRSYAAGERIVTQGEGGIGLFVILSGSAQAIHTAAEGQEIVVNSFGPTDFFGELAMLNDQPRTASVVATADTECLVLTRWEFLGKLETDAKMAVVILQELARRFQRTLGVL